MNRVLLLHRLLSPLRKGHEYMINLFDVKRILGMPPVDHPRRGEKRPRIKFLRFSTTGCRDATRGKTFKTLTGRSKEKSANHGLKRLHPAIVTLSPHKSNGLYKFYFPQLHHIFVLGFAVQVNYFLHWTMDFACCLDFIFV